MKRVDEPSREGVAGPDAVDHVDVVNPRADAFRVVETIHYDFGAARLDQLGGRLSRSAGRQQVVHDEHALTRLHTVLVHLHGV